MKTLLVAFFLVIGISLSGCQSGESGVPDDRCLVYENQTQTNRDFASDFAAVSNCRPSYYQDVVFVGKKFKKIALGDHFTCAITEDSQIECFGSNRHGQLTVPKLDNPQFLAAQGVRACAASSTELQCWGFHPFSLKLKGSQAFQDIGVSNKAVCWILTNGIAQCTGDSKIGANSPPSLSFFSSTKYSRILYMDDYYSCASKSDGSLACWGLTYSYWVFRCAFNPLSGCSGDEDLFQYTNNQRAFFEKQLGRKTNLERMYFIADSAHNNSLLCMEQGLKLDCINDTGASLNAPGSKLAGSKSFFCYLDPINILKCETLIASQSKTGFFDTDGGFYSMYFFTDDNTRDRLIYFQDTIDYNTVRNNLPVSNLADPFIQLGVGWTHGCALTQSGTLHCFGYDPGDGRVTGNLRQPDIRLTPVTFVASTGSQQQVTLHPTISPGTGTQVSVSWTQVSGSALSILQQSNGDLLVILPEQASKCIDLDTFGFQLVATNQAGISRTILSEIKLYNQDCQVGTADGLNLTSVNELLAGPSQSIYLIGLLGIGKQAIATFANKMLTTPSTPIGFNIADNPILPASAGNLLAIGSTLGIQTAIQFKPDGSNPQILIFPTAQNTVVNNSVKFIGPGPNLSVWFVANTGIISSNADGSWSTIATYSVLPSTDPMIAIVPFGASNTPLLVTSSNVYSLNGSTWKPLSPSATFGNPKDVYWDSSMIVITFEKCLISISQSTQIPIIPSTCEIQPASGITFNAVSKRVGDANLYWVATSQGLYTLDTAAKTLMLSNASQTNISQVVSNWYGETWYLAGSQTYLHRGEFVDQDRTNKIFVFDASYGANCSRNNQGNALVPVARQCNGQQNCSVTVTPFLVGGDPAPGCAKEFTVSYTCAYGLTYNRYIPHEAAQQMVTLTCE